MGRRYTVGVRLVPEPLQQTGQLLRRPRTAIVVPSSLTQMMRPRWPHNKGMRSPTFIVLGLVLIILGAVGAALVLSFPNEDPVSPVLSSTKESNYRGISIWAVFGLILVAVMGVSGVGKTTLLNLLGLLDKPTEGKIYLDGEDILTKSEREKAHIRNQKIGFVFQFYHLLPELLGIGNL